MTRQEDKALRQQINRLDYERRREQKIAYAKRYYQEHKGQPKQARPKEETIYMLPSTEALEAILPPALKGNLKRLRKEYLSIHISERPSYDYFLRCKVYLHLIGKPIWEIVR